MRFLQFQLRRCMVLQCFFSTAFNILRQLNVLWIKQVQFYCTTWRLSTIGKLSILEFPKHCWRHSKFTAWLWRLSTKPRSPVSKYCCWRFGTTWGTFIPSCFSLLRLAFAFRSYAWFLKTETFVDDFQKVTSNFSYWAPSHEFGKFIWHRQHKNK